MILFPMKIFGFAGYSGSGKTTLIEKLIPLIVVRGVTVSLIKHAHHDFDIDRPGKDSYRHRQAGATEILISSSRRWALMRELRGEPEPALEQLIEHILPCDLLLIEGFKREPIPKLEVHRRVLGEPLLFPEDKNIVAVASDTPVDTRLPVLLLNQPESIVDFILRYLEITKAARRVS